MTIVSINKKDWISGLNSAKKTYCLIGPIKSKSGYKFTKLENDKLPEFKYSNSLTSTKKFLFPQTEEILNYTLNNSDKVKETKNNNIPNAILGIRPCDAKANKILNINFNTSEIKDPYWIKNYENTTFIGLSCNNPNDTCFCTSVGSGPCNEEGMDILLFLDNNDNYLAKIITDKGKKFADIANWEKLSQTKIDKNYISNIEKKISSKISTNKFKEINNLELYENPLWDEMSFACLNCGICTFVCPTCWCFDIQDETSNNKGIRIKNWDSCMFPIFTEHTTGHNPRRTKKHRFRQRFMHKLKYFIDKYNSNIMCVGCGRCINSCPVNIDIRSICQKINTINNKNSL